MIDSILNISGILHSRVFTKLQEKAYSCTGRAYLYITLPSASSGKKNQAVLLPALSFMRIDKDGEPDAFYIRGKHCRRDLKNMSRKDIL